MSRILHLSNAGILVESEGKRFVIDPLNRKLTPYFGTPSTVFAALMDGVHPFDRLSAMIITHEHPDHFDPDAVTAFCRLRPRVPVLSTPRVISILEERLPLATNLIAVNPALHAFQKREIDGVTIRFMRLTHAGKGYEDVCNLACVLLLDRAVAHLGDSEGNGANLRAMASILPEGSVLCAPFPHLAIPRTFGLIRALMPAMFYVLHMPDPVEDRCGWLRAIHRAKARVEDMDVVLATGPGVQTTISSMLL